MVFRGDEKGGLQEWDRVYENSYHSNLGNPDKDHQKYTRKILRGSVEYPYPRRARTGLLPTESDPESESSLSFLMSLNIYVPRDERFGQLKTSDFLAFALKSIFQYPKSSLEAIDEDKSAWRSDEDFAREMLAGVNPVLIRLLEEFPPASKLDSKLYGDQNSTAIKKNKLFILDHHDPLMPYLRKINTNTSTKTYATRSILFLKAYVTVNDSGYHQLISHWLNTNAVIEPFMIATNRQLSSCTCIDNKQGILQMKFTLDKEISEWTSDQEPLQAFEEFGNKLAKIEENILSMNKDPKLKNRSVEYPYPRRARTGLPPTESDPDSESSLPFLMSLNIYVPRDERFGQLKMSDFLAFALKSSLEAIDGTPNEFDSFQDVLKLYEGGAYIPDSLEFPPASKLDSKLYGDQNSTVTAKHIESNLNGLTVNEKELLTPEYAELESNPDKAFLKTITSQLQTVVGNSVIEILSRHSTDEVYLGQRDIYISEWTSDQEPLQAFEEFGNKLAKIEENILAMNKDPKLKNR
ncbi:hypothetical protein EZV62_007295 [Acer yangbiense]|uniref:Lipoxygenase domain-containing protein n=1 Tax=Acer yangbiense TaxID=1000413 RepID=A0A5C7I9Q3_9ROSI|nr:hypothetical protein EZV62_007295 [Acer yangbiense]